MSYYPAYDGAVAPADGYYDDGGLPASQVWYYCGDPAGYYPYVTQCGIGWQMVPAG